MKNQIEEQIIGYELEELCNESVSLEKELEELNEKLNKTTIKKDRQNIEYLINLFQSIAKMQSRVSELEAKTVFLSRQNTRDHKTGLLKVQVTDLNTQLEIVLNEYDQLLLSIPESLLSKFLQHEIVGTQSFFLLKRLEVAKTNLPSEIETVIGDGLRSWSRLRQILLKKVEFNILIDDHIRKITGPEAIHLMFTSHPNANVRKELMTNFDEALKPNFEIFAMVMNEVTKLYLNRYKSSGLEILTETTRKNDIHINSLKAMEEVIKKNLNRFIPYFQRKAKLLELNGVGEKDLLASVNCENTNIQFDYALEMITEVFGQFNPSMEEYVKDAISNNWIDAEIRSDKSFIQCCIFFPESKQTRILMRYQGTYRCISTLAHELGHGYHYHQLAKQPYFSQNTPLSKAEIASTFAEMMITNKLIENAKNKDEKIVLLDERIKNSITYVLKPYVNFIFQKKVFKEIEKGYVTAGRLDELMIEVQEEVYSQSLSDYTPTTWISNNLFYLPNQQFYNYQYVLGYLFSAGLHAQVKSGTFSPSHYDLFLQDTGCMSMEDLAEKYLNINLFNHEFWQQSLDQLIKDIDLFLELTS